MIPEIPKWTDLPLPVLKKKRVVLFGGSFDPVHKGHTQMAKAAKEQLHADEVWFIPSASTPLKDRGLTDGSHRKNMLEAAIQGEKDMSVCPIELERQGTSYTIDTVKELKQKHPDCEFAWIIGADQLAQFDKWKDPDLLARLVHLACFARDGKLPKTKWNVKSLDMEPADISSTEIRHGEKLEWLDEKVLQYIYDNRLYVRDWVKARITDKRYLHTLSVADLTETFAKFNGLETNKAWLAGLFHDVAKSMNVPQMKPWMDKYAPEKLDTAPATWHGYVGAKQTETIYKIEDKEITNAIWHHVNGTSEEPIAMALYCADKLDPTRLYDSYTMIEACKKDLKTGYAIVKAENEAYLAKTLGKKK